MLTTPIICTPPISSANEDTKANVCWSKDTEFPLLSCRCRQKLLNMQPPPPHMNCLLAQSLCFGCSSIFISLLYSFVSSQNFTGGLVISYRKVLGCLSLPCRCLMAQRNWPPALGWTPSTAAVALDSLGDISPPRRVHFLISIFLIGGGGVLAITAPERTICRNPCCSFKTTRRLTKHLIVLAINGVDDRS